MDWEKFRDNIGFVMTAVSLALTVAFGFGLNGLVGDADPLSLVLVNLPALMFGGVAGWALRSSYESRRGKARIRSSVETLPASLKSTFDGIMANDGLAYTGLFEQTGDYEALEQMELITKFSDHADVTGSAGWMVKPDVRKALDGFKL